MSGFQIAVKAFMRETRDALRERCIRACHVPMRAIASRKPHDPFKLRMDQPVQGADFCDLAKKLRGWISSDEQVTAIALKAGDLEDRSVKFEDRPDVDLAMGGLYPHHRGFESAMTLDEWMGEGARKQVRFTATTESGKAYETDIALPSYHEAKRKKRERIIPILACPECHGELETIPVGLHCAECRNVYSTRGSSVNFLTAEYQAQYGIVETENISEWDYDEDALRVITENPDGIFLDCGAGFRRNFHPNIVNFEIADYTSTDVLGVAEQLPFRDGAFDGVICVAVLEHVKDPFRVAREITRVLKPGGLLFCAVPFLQPVHAFPHHYYNMTQEGLSNLFGELEIEKKYVPVSLHPMTSLKWILRSYWLGLPQSLQYKFMGMTVLDIMELPDFQECRKRHVEMIHDLKPEAWTELAGGNCIVARKR